MIILKFKFSKSNLTDFDIKLQKYYEHYNVEACCPHCNSNNLILYGSYKRTVIYEVNQKFISQKIRVKRVKCKSCGHTHALLPMDIVPYKQTVLNIIINCIYNDEYFNKTEYSYDTRNKWIKQYKMFLPYIKTMITNCTDIYQYIMKNISNFYSEFYNKNKKILLLMRRSFFNIGFL